jgi:hypothetical protein
VISQPSETSMLLTLITGIGIGSIIGAAISAIFSWRVAILNLRQASLNALRDDLATCLKELEGVYFAVANLRPYENDEDLPASLEKQRQEARIAFLFIYRRVLLGLLRCW